MIESLFVVSLPRSLSSFLYHVSCAALKLDSPSWTSDGEIMNAERFAFCREAEETGWPKFTQAGDSGGLDSRLKDYLDQVTVKGGFGYKDVIQPFVVSDWLPSTGPEGPQDSPQSGRRGFFDVESSMVLPRNRCESDSAER